MTREEKSDVEFRYKKLQRLKLNKHTKLISGQPEPIIAAHNGAILNAIWHFGNSAIAIATSRHVRNSIAEVQIRQFI